MNQSEQNISQTQQKPILQEKTVLTLLILDILFVLNIFLGCFVTLSLDFECM